jgi:hypothetical protein
MSRSQLNYLVPNAKNQYRKFETNIPRKGIARRQSQFPHPCVCEQFIYFHDRFAYIYLLQEICGSILGIHQRHMNVEIGTEAAQFPEKDCINGIFVAVHIMKIQKRGKNYLEPLKNKCIFLFSDLPPQFFTKSAELFLHRKVFRHGKLFQN